MKRLILSLVVLLVGSPLAISDHRQAARLQHPHRHGRPRARQSRHDDDRRAGTETSKEPIGNGEHAFSNLLE